MEKEEFMPVFLINGFLESGKTEFLTFTMQQDYFRCQEKTLLIVCEEGVGEYSEALLNEANTSIVMVESMEMLTPVWLEEMELLYHPSRILIEWNGMWNQEELRLPSDWKIYQQITMIDASTFGIYAKNMASLLSGMVKGSDLVVVNRCDQIEELSSMRRVLKAMNQKGEIIFEDNNGEVEELLEAELPFDLTQDVISISPSDYGIWYMDCLEKRERYEGKIVEFTAMVLKTPDMPKNYFVPGRMAMTCCEDDLTFLGYVCKARQAKYLDSRQWVKVQAKISYEYWPDYGDVGPVLYAESVTEALAVQEYVSFF